MGSSSGDAHDVSPGWPDREIGWIAGTQRGLITRSQLRELGVSESAIGRAARRGRLHRVHRGVYSLVPPRALPHLAAEHAALLAGGPLTLLSHRTAASVHGVPLSPDRQIHLTAVGPHRRQSHHGLYVHQTTSLDPADRRRIDRLAVTSLPRTAIDLAPSLNDRALERLVDETLKRTSAIKLHEALERHRGRPGTPRIRALLRPERPSALTWSDAEERLLGLIRRAGLPAPEANVPLGDYVPDLLWREQQVIVEFDSWSFHGGRRAFDHDRDRHNELAAQGYQVIHVTWRQLTERPEQVLVWIAAALALARAG